jgi:hypothetical protein
MPSLFFAAGKVLRHITFAALTLFTCGLFAFPWIVWANTNRERQVTLRMDQHGNVIRDRLTTPDPRSAAG